MNRLLLVCFCSVAGCFVMAGCDRSIPAPDLPALPEAEPTAADAPDLSAAERFRQAALSNPDGDVGAAWPQLFGVSRTSQVSVAIDPFWDDSGPTELWSMAIGTGYGSPVVAAGRVVFNHRIEDEEIVQCVQAATGEPIWEYRYPTTFETEYEYSNGPYSTPVIDQDQVIAVGGQGQIFCFELTSGELFWNRDLHQEYELEDDIFAVGSTPLVLEDGVVFNLGAGEKHAGIIALDRKTGETLWEATDHGAAYCSPFASTIHGQPFLFVITSIGLVSLHPDSGQVDWFIEHRSRTPMSFNAVSPLVDGDQVLAITGPGPGAVCVRVLADRSYEVLWKNRRVLDSQFNSLMLHHGKVFGFTAAGQGGAELRCVDVATGELRWKYHSLLRRGQGLIAGDAIVLLGERGHLASLLVNDQSPQVLSFTQQPLMSEPCYCAPALADGRLYLKDEQRLACFDVAP